MCVAVIYFYQTIQIQCKIDPINNILGSLSIRNYWQGQSLSIRNYWQGQSLSITSSLRDWLRLWQLNLAIIPFNTPPNTVRYSQLVIPWVCLSNCTYYTPSNFTALALSSFRNPAPPIYSPNPWQTYQPIFPATLTQVGDWVASYPDLTACWNYYVMDRQFGGNQVLWSSGW